MIGIGASELVMLLVMTGLPANDLASLIEPEGYLRSRGVELKADKLIELAVQEPKTGKEQMIQLLAIRWLGKHADEVKKIDGAVDTLREIAEGKKGRDAQSFARDQAARALARIEGKPAPTPRRLPAGSVRSEALAWFPATALVVGATDLRPPVGAAGPDPEAFAAVIAALVPEREMKPVYDFVDAVGNIRLDRVSVAFETNETEPDKSKIWVRFTGAADRKRLEAFLAKEFPEREERKPPSGKGFRGEPVVILSKKDSAPAFALVGNTDLVMAGYKSNQGNHIELVDALLAVRAGKSKGVRVGPFDEVLKGINENASQLLIAKVPENFRSSLFPGLPLADKDLPTRVVVEVTGGKAITARVRGTMKSEDDAAQAAKSLESLKAEGIKHLKDIPAEANVPRDLVNVARKVLDSMKIATDGAVLTLTAEVPSNVAMSALKAVETMFGPGRKP